MAQHVKNYAGIDYFRIPAALFVVAIHTAPLSSWSKSIDFLITYCLGRIAVPFFFMTTGFFVLAPYVRSGFQKNSRFHRYLKKTCLLYLFVSLLYLPIGWYAKNLPHSIGGYIKALLFDGIFYHLWYFPAAIVGCAILTALMKKSPKAAIVFASVAYLLGLAGDSYYSLTEQIPVLKNIYDAIFSISSYTRNGIFFAPAFLLLGITAANRKFRYPRYIDALQFALSLLLLMLEGHLTYIFRLQRHNSMYLFLPISAYFLFRLLLRIPGKAPRIFRNGSMILYVIHPAVIILVRGFAKITGLTGILVSQSFLHYLAVCLTSLLLTAFILFVIERRMRICTRKEEPGLN